MQISESTVCAKQVWEIKSMRPLHIGFNAVCHGSTGHKGQSRIDWIN